MLRSVWVGMGFLLVPYFITLLLLLIKGVRKPGVYAVLSVVLGFALIGLFATYPDSSELAMREHLLLQVDPEEVDSIVLSPVYADARQRHNLVSQDIEIRESETIRSIVSR